MKTEELVTAEHAFAVAARDKAEAARKARKGKAKHDAHGEQQRCRGDMPKAYFDTLRDQAGNSDARQAGIAGRRRRSTDAAERTAHERIEILKLSRVRRTAGRSVLSFCDVTARYADEPRSSSCRPSRF